MNRPFRPPTRPGRRASKSLLLAALLVSPLPTTHLAAEPAGGTSLSSPGSSAEYENCANRLFAVLFYTTWKNTFPSADSPLVFGIFGELADRKLIEESLRAKFPRPLRFRTVTNTEEAAACHALYLPNATASERRALLQAIEGKTILSIGEFRGQDAPACMIEFVRPATKGAHNKPTPLRTEIHFPSPNSGISFQAPLCSLAARQAQAAR